MGCRCCRMIKSYIYDPTVPVDAHSYKQDHSSNSLVPPYQCHRLPNETAHKKHGFHNLAYTGNSSPTKSDIDNNHINQLHVNNQARSSPPQLPESDSILYIMHPEGGLPPVQTFLTLPSAPPMCSMQPMCSMLGTEPFKQADSFRDSGLGNGGTVDGNNGSGGRWCGQEEEEEGEGWRQERREAGAPEHVGDVVDEESVISVDIHTSSTSLSSADTKLAEDDEERENPVGEKKAEDSVSITESMVAEALAALEAATAGEEDE
ncbi:uncharacterized protein zgc:194930 [Electrophorus electricus]|uniref:Uncharacterized protein n=1 Tax=Electrophorus electricus TaxID=8005 RepID=A0AAY5EBH7_ELEEL|nr:uncharacterized protein zgc:194930 [Electrophorus electricus]